MHVSAECEHYTGFYDFAYLNWFGVPEALGKKLNLIAEVQIWPPMIAGGRQVTQMLGANIVKIFVVLEK